MSENVEIVASFPLPPKKFYEHLSVEEISVMKPPQLPETDESITIFGNEQQLTIEDQENLMVTQEMIGDLRATTDKLFQNYRQLLEGIDAIQDSSKIQEFTSSIDEPFQEIFTITGKLAKIQAVASLRNSLEKEFGEIEQFLNN